MVDSGGEVTNKATDREAEPMMEVVKVNTGQYRARCQRCDTSQVMPWISHCPGIDVYIPPDKNRSPITLPRTPRRNTEKPLDSGQDATQAEDKEG